MTRRVASAWAIACLALASCARTVPGEFAGRELSPVNQDYFEPRTTSIAQFAILDGDRQALWDAVTTRLEENGLLLEHEDRAAGELAARYSGNPEPYVDCGMLVHRNLADRSEKHLPAARDNLQYDLALDYRSVWVFRKIWLDGWMIVRIGPGGVAKTRGEANIRAAPTTEAEVLETLPTGAPVTVLGPSGTKGWYLVEAAGRSPAYIADFLVTVPKSTAVNAQVTYVLSRTLSVGSGEDVQRTRDIVSFVTGESASFEGGTLCVAKGSLEQLALRP